MSDRLSSVLRTDLGQALKEGLTPEKEFWSSRKTVEELSKSNYFLDEGAAEATWPELFNTLLGMSAGGNDVMLSLSLSLSFSRSLSLPLQLPLPIGTYN